MGVSDGWVEPMNATATVTDKAYETLTDRQQAIIDELAQDRIDGRDRTHAEIAAAAADGEDFDTPHSTWVYKIRDKYPDILDERVDVLMNGHDGKREIGNVAIEGELDLTDQPPLQAQQDRPVKGTWYDCPECDESFPTYQGLGGHMGAHNGDEPQPEALWPVTLTPEAAFELIASDAPADIRRDLFDQVAGR